MLFSKRKKLNIFILLAAAAAVLSLPVAATATIFIPSDPCIGTWDSANRIYTLTTDVNETIQIEEDNLTLDGDGYTVTGAGSGYGVDLFQRSHVTITNLTVEGFATGINLYQSSNNTLTGNSVSYNSGVGIYLHSSATNTLTGNTVASNNGYGIYLYSSSGNLIYNNNFINNNTQAYVLGTGNVFNQDLPTGGNYWSNWTSPDVAPEDGFVDSPYTFNVGGVDNLPWTEMDGWQQTPSDMMLDLADDVIALNLQQGISNSLDAKLNAALQALDDINANNDVAAINTLQAFINAVEAQSGDKIPVADADALIAAAQEIIDLLSAE